MVDKNKLFHMQEAVKDNDYHLQYCIKNMDKLKAEMKIREKELIHEFDKKSKLEYDQQLAENEKLQGNIFVKDGKWKEAIESYSKAIELDPNNSIFYANRSLCFLKLELPESAENDCNKAIELDPFYWKAYLRRSSARKATNKLEEALTDLKVVLKGEPNNKFVQSEIKLVSDLLKDKLSPSMVSSRQLSCHSKENNYIYPVKKRPHERSQIPLKRIKIEDCIDFISNKNNEQVEKTLDSNSDKQNFIASKVTLEQNYLDKFEIPKTSVKFMEVWKKIQNDSKKCYKFLKALDGRDFPDIFKESLEAEVFSKIIEIFSSEFVPSGDNIFLYLFGLTNVKRFPALSMFLSSTEKESISKLINYCVETKECSAAQAYYLKWRYELLP